MRINRKDRWQTMIEWIFRTGVAGEFVGHGLLAIGGKKEWIAWISQLIHVDAQTAMTLLLLIGVSDRLGWFSLDPIEQRHLI